MPSVYGDGYYAELDISVDSSGFVTIDGYTDHPSLLVKDSQSYTSKSKDYWVLNISLDEVFSAFVYTVRLPRDADTITYLNSPETMMVTWSGDSFIVRGYGEDRRLSIVIGYQLRRESRVLSGLNEVLVVIIVVIILLLVILLLYTRRRVSKRRMVEEAGGFDLKGLNERQREIINLLLETGRPLTQSEIERQLNIPKASVSRNIHSLERKGLIVKEQRGMSNLISLKKR